MTSSEGPAVADPKCPVCQSTSRPEGRRLGGHDIYACDGCSHRFSVAEPASSEAYEALYADGSYAESIVADTLKRLDEDFAEHPTYRPFFEQVDVGEFPRLLDVGCGSGRFCRAARAHGWEVTGVDVSSTAVEVASRIVDGTFHVMGLDEAAERLKDFDVVTAFEVLEHMKDPVDTVDKLTQMVRPGGVVLVTVPCWDSARMREGCDPEGDPPRHVQFFTSRSLRRVFDRCGLVDVVVRGIRVRPPVRGLRSLVWALRRRLGAALGLCVMGRRR